MANHNVLSSTRNESDREGDEARERGRRLSNFILSKREKKISRNEKRCTVHKQHSSCEYNHDESGGDTKSLQRSLYQRRDNSVLTHSITITQLDLYLQCTNESFSLTPFSPARYSSPALPHSVTPLHSHAHTSLHS